MHFKIGSLSFTSVLKIKKKSLLFLEADQHSLQMVKKSYQSTKIGLLLLFKFTMSNEQKNVGQKFILKKKRMNSRHCFANDLPYCQFYVKVLTFWVRVQIIRKMTYQSLDFNHLISFVGNLEPWKNRIVNEQHGFHTDKVRTIKVLLCLALKWFSYN